MAKNTIIIGVVLLIIGIGVGYALWGRSASAPSGMHMMPDGSLMGRDIDQHFIAQMIPHHEGAIAMAKVALERSQRPEMLALANAIIAAQEKEIRDMSGWYQSWFGAPVPQNGMGAMHMGGMTGEPDALASVSASDFDREFITQMIPHHEMAVVMAQMLAASTERAEMQKLANDIITSQSSEIEMMRGWLNKWYGE